MIRTIAFTILALAFAVIAWFSLLAPGAQAMTAILFVLLAFMVLGAREKS